MIDRSLPRIQFDTSGKSPAECQPHCNLQDASGSLESSRPPTRSTAIADYFSDFEVPIISTLALMAAQPRTPSRNRAPCALRCRCRAGRHDGADSKRDANAWDREHIGSVTDSASRSHTAILTMYERAHIPV